MPPSSIVQPKPLVEVLTPEKQTGTVVVVPLFQVSNPSDHETCSAAQDVVAVIVAAAGAAQLVQ